MTLVIVGTAILVVITIGYILFPVFRASATGHLTDSAASDRLADLLARRDAVYEAIRDADFDLETGKLTEEDHRVLRERLTAEGVRLLQELDRLMQSEVREDLEQEIEREVAELRERRAAETAPATESRRAGKEPATVHPDTTDGKHIPCPECGQSVRASAQLCTKCGASLALTCPDCGASVDADDRFCSKCGLNLSPVGAKTREVHGE